MEKIKLTKKREEIVSMMGFDSIMSVLRYYPYRYDYYANTKLKMDLHNKTVTFEGVITNVVSVNRFKKLVKIIFMVRNSDDEVKVIMFNSNIALKYIKVNQPIVLTGKYNAFANEITLSSYFLGSLNGKERFTPIYSLPSDIKDHTYRQMVDYFYNEAIASNVIKDHIPSDLIAKYRLTSLDNALKWIHDPTSKEELTQAYRYLKYEELLDFAMVCSIKRELLNKGYKISKNINYDKVKEYIHSLPYKLTDDQKFSLKEILNDLDSKAFMSRLLQGDVGSGKTIVATISMLAVVNSGYQAAIMAPTDILARQHYKSIVEALKNTSIRICLLVSNMTNKEKKDVLNKIANKEADIVVGTHALIQEKVNFKNLGLAIIDEQHRFGVKQRIALKEKGSQIDCLYMSATPIPRTLASTIYLDMDISTIATYPYKERVINSKFINKNSIRSEYSFINEYLKSGQKVYVVCPSINDSIEELNSVTTIYESYKKRFKDYNVAFIHGKLTSEEKDKIMEDFNSDKTSILVSTTVIEVGINVKKANMMIIYNAERFGLAQLHQLRGRIARDGSVGYCYFLSSDDSEDVIERLSFLASCNDGFKISEYDLKRRGSGELLGLMQSGKSELKIANILDDFNILKVAGSDAKNILINKAKYIEYIRYIYKIINITNQYVE